MGRKSAHWYRPISIFKSATLTTRTLWVVRWWPSNFRPSKHPHASLSPRTQGNDDDLIPLKVCKLPFRNPLESVIGTDSRLCPSRARMVIRHDHLIELTYINSINTPFQKAISRRRTWWKIFSLYGGPYLRYLE